MNKLRPYTAMTMMLVLALMAVTGLLLYLSPQGPSSRLWEFLGLSKHQIKDLHFCLALVMIGSAILHGFLNLSSLTSYLKRPTKLWQHPLLFAAIVVMVTFSLAMLL